MVWKVVSEHRKWCEKLPLLISASVPSITCEIQALHSKSDLFATYDYESSSIFTNLSYKIRCLSKHAVVSQGSFGAGALRVLLDKVDT
jgi:hypothetical protein